MIELDFDDSAVRGLDTYVRQVRLALGLRGDSSFIQPDTPLSAYIALDGRLPEYPDHDVALLWDEHAGWSAAVEGDSTDEPLPVANLGADLLPAPEAVAEWVRGLFEQKAGADREAGTDRPVERVLVSQENMRHHLTAYIRSVVTAATTGFTRTAGVAGAEQ